MIVEQHWLAAASDVYAASSLRLPLGVGVPLEAQLVNLGQKGVRRMGADSIAFNMRLPAVDGLPIKELLALRESERDAFEGFRDSLAEAFRERAKLGNEGMSQAEIADEIVADVVNPRLHEIERRLHAAQALLTKKHLYNLAIAGLATACGIIGAVDFGIATEVAAIANTSLAQYAFHEQISEISLSDMYFMWKAKEYAERKVIKGRRKNSSIRSKSPR